MSSHNGSENNSSEGTINRSQRSDFIEDIISKKPSFIIRKGASIAFFMILLLCLCSTFIKIPDTVSTTAEMVSLNPAKTVEAKVPSKLIKIAVKDGSMVSKGDFLASLESTANYLSVIKLSKIIDSSAILLEQLDYKALDKLLSTRIDSLGELQEFFQIFIQSYTEFRNYSPIGIFPKKLKMLEKDKLFLKKLHNNVSEEARLTKQDLSLTQKTFDANTTLLAQKVLSEFDYRIETSKLISKKLTPIQLNSALITNEILQHEKDKEIAELRNKAIEQTRNFIYSINTFKSQIEKWKQKYILTAPISGIAIFKGILLENQNIAEGQTLFYIDPKNTEYYAILYLPQSNFGKLKIGQKVLMKLPAYPYHEFGVLKGNIEYISPIISEKGYFAKISLPNALLTSHNIQVKFKEGLIGQAEVVIESRSLFKIFISRIFK